MSKEKIEDWKRKYPQGKAPLAWTLADYLVFNEEPPASIVAGGTEGEQMEKEDVPEWAKEEIQALSVLQEEYPEDFEEQLQNFLLDLEYLKSLDKITQEEFEELSKRENFSFGK